MTPNFLSVEVHAITIDPESNSPVLLLKERGGNRTLPIWIGMLEATAIATEMEKVTFIRPMTHDLIVNILGALDAKVIRVAITELKDNTFYAVVRVRQGEREIEIDARPSDAIAIALRSKAEILVSQEVMEAAYPKEPVTIYEKDIPKDKKRLAELLEKLDPQDFKYKM